MKLTKSHLYGVLLSGTIAVIAIYLNTILPTDLLGSAVIALLIGMVLNPFIERSDIYDDGISWTSKYVLRAGIIIAGVTLSFYQLVEAGKYALVLLFFTLITAFGVGYLMMKVFKMDWKLTSLLSVSTAICGGTAVATVGPTIRAKNRDIAYAISATFIFDILTVIAFPYIGQWLGLSDTGYGLWVGTSVNDTSSVVAAGYAFSDASGVLATIVKLTRTLFIVPIVLIFSWIYAKKEASTGSREKVNIASIFPWFILGFLGVVALRTVGIIPETMVSPISSMSKFFLAMALGAIGLKTNLTEVSGVGFKPMVAAVIIDVSVVIVALIAQGTILQYL
ncbi:MAG TPA: YeiH family protein [Atopostipes sp.]|nr:YeiH family protein [Atopostipes sp.]